MELEDLDWGNVPQHVNVIAHKDGTVNFVINLQVLGEESQWGFEGDECDITGCVINPNEGWPKGWRVLERPNIEQSPTQGNTSAVVDWLDKLAYVIQTDSTVGSLLDVNLRGQAIMESDHGSIIGNKNVAEFINNRYYQLIEQANKSKREELLAEIAKAKELYESKLAELNLLENGL